MIKNFKNKKLKRFFDEGSAAALPAGQAQKIADVLAALDTAEDPSEVGLFPGWRPAPVEGRFERVLERHNHRQLAGHFPLCGR